MILKRSKPPVLPKGVCRAPLRTLTRPTWDDQLKTADYPRDVVVIDFETFFNPSYKTGGDSSTVEYVLDDQFEVLGVSVLTMPATHRNKDPKAGCHWFNGEEGAAQLFKNLQHVYGKNLERCTVVAHNLRFEAAIMMFRYDISPKYMIDTLGLARHWDARNKNGLEHIAKRHKWQAKGNTQKFKGWTNRIRYTIPKQGRAKAIKMPVQMPTMTEDQQKELADYANHDVYLEWLTFCHYMERLSNPHAELRIMHHTMQMYTNPILQVDAEKGEEIIRDMEAEIDRTVDALNVIRNTTISRQDLSGNNSFDRLMTEALEWANDDPLRYRKPCQDKNHPTKFAIAADDPERELLEQHADPYVKAMMAAKLAMTSWPKHQKRVRRIIAQGTTTLDALPVPLNYYGAHTGRWSGAEKINLQNLGSRGHRLIARIREMLIAPSDSELVIADASQIEARVLAWVADEQWLLDKFASGEEVYCGFAEQVLGKHVRKPVPEHLWDEQGCDPIEEEWFKWARNSVGKVGVLGCGYGMGGEKAISYSGDSLDAATADALVATYRRTHPMIVKFWKKIERAFVYTARYKKPCSLTKGITFHSTEDCDVIMTLPSGREIKYHNVRTKRGKWGIEASVWHPTKRYWAHIWGGHLTENVVQAMSRDLLWQAMEAVETDGYRIALHVHDEIIACVAKGKGQSVLKLCIDKLTVRPKWGPTLPLAAEGVVTSRYGGH